MKPVTALTFFAVALAPSLALADPVWARVPMRDPTLFGAGIATATFGGAALLTGIGLMLPCALIDSAWFTACPASPYLDVAVPMIVAGSLALLGGIAWRSTAATARTRGSHSVRGLRRAARESGYLPRFETFYLQSAH